MRKVISPVPNPTQVVNTWSYGCSGCLPAHCVENHCEYEVVDTYSHGAFLNNSCCESGYNEVLSALSLTNCGGYIICVPSALEGDFETSWINCACVVVVWFAHHDTCHYYMTARRAFTPVFT